MALARALLLVALALLAAAGVLGGCGGSGDGEDSAGTDGGGNGGTSDGSDWSYAAQRAAMIAGLRDRIRSERVLEALGRVPRHEFVMEESRDRSYEDVPLPIAEGQTMYSPHLVAELTELLELDGAEKVLEIGTGSGYQTSVIAELAGEVFTIEIVPALKERAQKRVEQLRAAGRLSSRAKIHFVVGDGAKGLPDQGPFDVILVSAAMRQVPEELERQLAPGGRLLVPVGSLVQKLLLIERSADGEKLERTEKDLVRWDELIGGDGQR